MIQKKSVFFFDNKTQNFYDLTQSFENQILRHINADAFYDACLLVFQGISYREISKKLGVSTTTLTSWARRDDWTSLQKELHGKKQGSRSVLFAKVCRRGQVLNAIDAKATPG